ncbi:hypothetical protein K491DRAFT_673607 [Lophiostoma macrostomum CBS 122681]|uniref:Ubiquitin carboxyl-terminal hydrolase 14 n=1 Tax=Lophiostoma macrostomum CBS 122681 TaxID=1314788 RepID=A0A6A6TPF6_9PLEO|nr:hypothetical protein K491DRAFT_673607 [Lophiostoma macrostomum CBS 122681]
MARKSSKRPHEQASDTHAEGSLVKRQRTEPEESKLPKLAKLYNDLAAESEDIRLEAARQIVLKLSPENSPSAEAVETALSRLILGLCSRNKAARLGFFVTLTELLHQLYAHPKGSIDGFSLTLHDVVHLVEEKTKVKGNVSGEERRDYILGRLFGHKAILQSRILMEPQISLGCWNTVLEHVFQMAQDLPWLREECGLVLVEVTKGLGAQPNLQQCAEAVIQRLVAAKLTNTPEGVAIWLTVRDHFNNILPTGTWHNNDPMSKKERTRLADVLKENFRSKAVNNGDANIKSGNANPNPKFVWVMVLLEMLQRDQVIKHDDTNSVKLGFPQLWTDIVDNNLFNLSSSHERRLWGFKLFTTMIKTVPLWAIPSLFSPNLMRSWRNQSKKDDRYLHSSAHLAMQAVHSRVQQEAASALPIVEALTTKHGRDDVHRFSHKKVLEQILLATDDNTLKAIIRYLSTLLIRPDTQDQVAAEELRRLIADMLLNTVGNYRRYKENPPLADDEHETWLHNVLDILVEHAYFVPSEHAKRNKSPSPPFTDPTRTIFQERLSSCLTRLLSLGDGSRTPFAYFIVDLIRSKAASKTHKTVLDADDSVLQTIKKSFKTLDKLIAKVYNGDADAVLLLDDLDSSRKSLLKTDKDKIHDGQEAFVEILLTFLGNPRALFARIAQEAFTTFTVDITGTGLLLLTDVLDIAETPDGQRQLFEQGDEENSPSRSDVEDLEEGSDVEMIEGLLQGQGQSESDDRSTEDSDSSNDGSDDETDEEDEELTRFNNLLANTLQTSKPTLNGEESEESSDEDMDDEQMMALDPHLTKIFQERSKIASKSQQRKDAKQTVVQFKSRVLDLLAIFMEKQCSSSLTLHVLLPVLRRIRAGSNQTLADKSFKLLKTYTDYRARKAALPSLENLDQTWELLRGIHEEANLGGGASVHSTACSLASLHLVKILVGSDKDTYRAVVDVYAGTQKQWFADRKSGIHPVFFNQFQNCIVERYYLSSSNGGITSLILSKDAWRLLHPPQLSTQPFPFPSSRVPAILAGFYLNIEYCKWQIWRASTSTRRLRTPGPNQSVYREDCTQCFDSIDDPTGLDVCLFCFNGGCTSERNHSLLHVSSSNHPLVLNIKRTRKKVKRDEPPQKVSKLAIAAETEADRYDTTTQVKCYECGVDDVDKSAGKLPQILDAVLKANTFARQEEVKAWELEKTACEHTLCLEQDAARQIESQNLGHCSACDLKENLWLCLTCGNLGCGRAQFGGIGGNSHGVAHTQSTHHPVAVKLGSLTADGNADIYCYACDEERIDPELPNHLAHWGINIKDRIKTEKSLTEMQVEQNLLWEFSMTTEDGKELKPLFGPGLTGLKNLGNSCYLASTLQSLFSFPEFADRYYLLGEAPSSAPHPAEDLETQLRKIADGLLSGRYSKPDSDVIVSEHTPENPYQKGLAPAMLKHLIGRGHSEFSTMRQQDAFELLLHLLKLISRSQHVAPHKDPVESFRFVMEQRLQCIGCKKVRYRLDEQENISIPVPIRRVAKDTQMEVTDSEGKEKEKEEFERVTLQECLDIFTAEEMVELTCTSCGSKDGFLKKSLFKTFPSVLAVNARRFELVNWVPTKQDVPVIVDDEPFSFDAYHSSGLQEGEELLSDDADADAPKKWVPNEAALSMLEAMGFPRVRCEKALHATGNSDPEAASNWLFGHMEDPDIDTPVDFNAGSGGSAASAIDPEKVENLGAMGFLPPQARQALKETGGDMERAVDWLFSHPDATGDVEEDKPEASGEVQEKSLAGSDKLPANFQLQSIVCHKGSSIHAGHYVAFIRKQLPNEKSASWVLFNDEKVAQAADVEEMKKFAYVYFFRRL